MELLLSFLYQFSFGKVGSVTNLESDVYLLLLPFPGIISNEMEIMHPEFIAVLCFHTVTAGHINCIFFNILLDYEPGTTTQSKPFALADCVKPIAAMCTQFLSGFQFNNRPFLFS